MIAKMLNYCEHEVCLRNWCEIAKLLSTCELTRNCNVICKNAVCPSNSQILFWSFFYCRIQFSTCPPWIRYWEDFHCIRLVIWAQSGNWCGIAKLLSNCNVICESADCQQNQCEIAKSLQILKFFFLLQNPVLYVFPIESVLRRRSLYLAGDNIFWRHSLGPSYTPTLNSSEACSAADPQQCRAWGTGRKVLPLCFLW